MKTAARFDHYRVLPGAKLDLSKIDQEGDGKLDKDDAKALFEEERASIIASQEKLYAEGKQSLLIVLQAMDAGGKDGTIEDVFRGVNPQGCRVSSFKVPTAEELAHDFLWRVHAQAPGKGQITIFNRSHYEDVLVVRVKNIVSESVWRSRYALINDFERLLATSGTRVLKFFLHISKKEQKKRFESRLADENDRWKWSPGDLVERALWDRYEEAYEGALRECSTEAAPWYVIPADKKWLRNAMVAHLVAATLRDMDPRFPPPLPDLGRVKIPD